MGAELGLELRHVLELVGPDVPPCFVAGIHVRILDCRRQMKAHKGTCESSSTRYNPSVALVLACGTVAFAGLWGWAN